MGLQPIIVVNKIDRPDARPLAVLDETMELLLDLEAEHHIDDLPHVFASAKAGYVTSDPGVVGTSMEPLLEVILDRIPGPEVASDEPLQMLVTTIDWSPYVGRIAIGRLRAGSVSQGQTVSVLREDGPPIRSRISQLEVFHNLGRSAVAPAEAGEVVAISGLDPVDIGDTIVHPDHPRPLPRLRVDLPTLEMVFGVNSSPFAGREGKYVTTRQIRERLYRELERNVALAGRPD